MVDGEVLPVPPSTVLVHGNQNSLQAQRCIAFWLIRIHRWPALSPSVRVIGVPVQCRMSLSMRSILCNLMGTVLGYDALKGSSPLCWSVGGQSCDRKPAVCIPAGESGHSVPCSGWLRGLVLRSIRVWTSLRKRGKKQMFKLLPMTSEASNRFTFMSRCCPGPSAVSSRDVEYSGECCQ